MNTGNCREIKYPPNGRSLRIRLEWWASSTATAAAGDWFAGGENVWLAANAKVETQRMAAHTEAIGKVIPTSRSACNLNCDDSGVATTSGVSSAKISTFRTCESAMCNNPSTRIIRGGESLTPQ